jgi:multidrug efflux system membrane fusion protein
MRYWEVFNEGTFRKRLRLFWVTAIGVAGALLLNGCSKPQPKQDIPAAPVTVGDVVRKDMPVEIRAIGSVQPYTQVSVKSQINGEVVKQNFKEGQDVKKGDLLFLIDPRPFQAALDQANGQLAKDVAAEKQAAAALVKDQAQAKYANAENGRYKGLVSEGVITPEQADQVRTNSEAMEATVGADRAAIENARAAIKADEAAVEGAKIQLGFCQIRSPIDGRVGSILLYQGNVVKANDTGSMVVINQVLPIYLSFSVPEQFIPDVKKYMASGQLKVEATAGNDPNSHREGILTFVDNTVDQTTGTIQLKATFQNHDRSFWPGQYVNVVLRLSTQSNAIVVPARAVQNGQQGQFVYVVKSDATVESRPVVPGRSTDAETVIENGLQAGETVVTDGQLRLFPGAKIEIKNSPSGQAVSRESGR